jgi:midasin
MSEHELGTSALKGLCVLTQALQSLEVGELAVARIREGMNLVHSFKDPLTQEKSEWMMGQFRFDFGRNSPADMSYPRFLHQCIDYLSNSGKAELQLVLLITDGRLNKQQVRPWLRKAQNILFLCIIVDNPKSSILSMKSTSFSNGEAGPQVTLRPYMEDFPFAHYIVLENPNLLVESMCDVVRQWFDFVKEL